MDNPYVARSLCILIGYLFGVFQTAYFYGRLKGIDIRKHGSGNAGTTNTLRVLGTKAGLIVLFGDMIKCILAIVVTTLIFRGIHPDMIYLLKIYTAAGCVLGHDFPFYMNFKGGKGIACTAGYLIAFHWIYIPIGLAAFFIPFLLTHFVSLGSLCLYTSFVVALGVLGQIGFFGMEQMLLFEMYFIAFLMTVLAFWQHRANIARLLHGNERKTFLFKKKDASAEQQAEEKNR